MVPRLAPNIGAKKYVADYPAQPYSEGKCPYYRVPKLAPNLGVKNYSGDYPSQPYRDDIILAIWFPDWHQNLVPKNTWVIILPNLITRIGSQIVTNILVPKIMRVII